MEPAYPGSAGFGGKERRDCLELCNRAADLLRLAGFEFRHASRTTEACYYGWPGRSELIRVAAHAFGGAVQGKADVIAKITYGTDMPQGRGATVKISMQSADRRVAEAIGHYFLKVGQREARVAQLDSASDSESEGCRFEPCRGHHPTDTPPTAP